MTIDDMISKYADDIKAYENERATRSNGLKAHFDNKAATEAAKLRILIDELGLDEKAIWKDNIQFIVYFEYKGAGVHIHADGNAELTMWNLPKSEAEDKLLRYAQYMKTNFYAPIKEVLEQFKYTELFIPAYAGAGTDVRKRREDEFIMMEVVRKIKAYAKKNEDEK